MVLGVFVLAGQLEALTVSPPSPTPGAEVLVDVGGLTAGSDYELELSDGSGASWPLAGGTADRIGALSLTATLPRISPGPYQFELYANRTLVVSQRVTVSNPAQLTFDPPAAAPGERVIFSATNLPYGQYTLSLEGLRLFGPQAAEGSLEGSFVVPYQRTATPAEVVIDFRGRSGRVVLVSASAPFSILDGEGPYTVPRAISADLPSEPLSRQQTSRVSGQLELPPRVLQNPDTRISVVTSVCPEDGTLPDHITECIMLPVNRGSVTLEPDGAFSASVSGVSILAGDATFPSINEGTVDGGLVFISPDERSGSVELGLLNPGIPLPSKTLTVSLKKGFSDGEPLEGALVNLQGGILVDPDCPDGDCDPARESGGSGPWQTNNQFSDWISNVGNLVANPGFSCPLSLARGFTDANGEFTFTLDPEHMIFVAKALNATRSVFGQLGDNVNVPMLPWTRYFPFQLKINALSLLNEEQSYGFINANGQATGAVYPFFYDVQTNRFHEGNLELALPAPGEDPDPLKYPLLFGNSPSNTLSFAFPPVNADELELTEDPFMPGLSAGLALRREPGSDPLLRFSHIYGYPDRTRFPDSVFQITRQLEVRFKHDSLTFGALQNVALFIEGSRLSLEVTADGETCNVEGDEYATVIPNAHRLTPGVYDLRLEASLQASDTPVSREFQLVVQPGPDWLASDTLDNPRISWAPDRLELIANEKPQMLDVSATVSDFDIGTLQNDSHNDAILTQSVDLNGFSSIRRFGMSDNQAMNRVPQNPPKGLNPPPLSGGGGTMEFGSEVPQTLIDTGKIPLFRYVWGVPPIADATLGVDFWFKLMLTYFGHVTVGDGVTSKVEINPVVQAGLDLFIDVSILFDIVSLDMTASPQIGIEMPFCVIDGAPQTSEELFKFLLRLSYEVSVGVCPLCIGAGGTFTPVDLCEGNGCPSSSPGSICPDSKLSALRLNANKGDEINRPQLSARYSAIASNGRGGSLAAWVGDDGHIYSQEVSAGGSLIDELAIASPRGITGLDTVWFSRDRGLMVWAQSALDETTFEQFRQDFRARGFDGNWQPVSSQQHLRYALYENGGWSAPMDLTLPNGGEGGVKLAVCADDPARGSGCPAGGEALAVWTRDLDGDLAGNQRVFFSRFNGGTWSAPERVDPGSSSKELQPSATYVNGNPVVVWVRNPSRSLADLAQRELAYRFLNSPDAGIVPTELAKGVASPIVRSDLLDRLIVAYSAATDTAAFLGNRRSLRLAIADCTLQPCSWAEQEILDDDQRRIYVERPQLEVTPEGFAVMVFRHLGYGSLNGQPLARADDSPGAISGLGDLAMVTFDLATNANYLEPLTVDGALNLNPEMAYDPLLGELLVTSAPAEAVVAGKNLPGAKRVISGGTGRLGTGAGPRLNRLGNVPDLAVVSISADAEWPDPFLPITVRFQNRGAPFAGEVPIQLNWDGPPDTGRFVWFETIPDPGIGGTTREYFVSFAEGDFPDEIHRLYVTIDPEGEFADRNGSNNQLTRLFGQLPVPEITSVKTSPRSRTTQIDFSPESDSRVVGYRVYRSTNRGPFVPIGTTFTHGYLDVTGDSDEQASYRLTSFSARGQESALGLPAERQPVKTEVIFRSGFEPL